MASRRLRTLLNAAALVPLVAGGAWAQGQAPRPSPGAQAQRMSLIERCDARAKRTEKRVVGGGIAPPRTAPWQVQLFSTQTYSEQERRFDSGLDEGDECKRYLDIRADFETVHKCGGSYIGGGWIVTAAHCVRQPPSVDGRPGNLLTDRRVRMGTQNIRVAGADFAIDGVVSHAAYNGQTKANDIALVHIVDDGRIARLTAQRLLAPVPMAPASTPLARGEALRVTGWGWTGRRDSDAVQGFAILRDRDGQVQHISARLRQLALNNLDAAACTPYYPGFDRALMVCAAALEADGRTIAPGKDACQYDSGGPLTRLSRGGQRRELVGIVAAGIGCGAGKPAIYTRVSAYADWIARARRAWVRGRVITLPERARAAPAAR